MFARSDTFPDRGSTAMVRPTLVLRRDV